MKTFKYLRVWLYMKMHSSLIGCHSILRCLIYFWTDNNGTKQGEICFTFKLTGFSICWFTGEEIEINNLGSYLYVI